jgi:hypothetical protein
VKNILIKNSIEPIEFLLKLGLLLLEIARLYVLGLVYGFIKVESEESIVLEQIFPLRPSGRTGPSSLLL